jgi:hypothetical protein
MAFDYHQPVFWSFRVDDFPTQSSIDLHKLWWNFPPPMFFSTEAGGSLALLHWSVSRGTLRRFLGRFWTNHPRESMEVSEKNNGGTR